MAKVLTPGHRYELENFEDKDASGQVIQFIEKKTVTQMRLDGQMPPDNLLGGDMLDELVTINDGTTNEEVIKALIDRLLYLDSKFPCIENTQTIINLKQALFWQNERTRGRQARGVEGKHMA